MPRAVTPQKVGLRPSPAKLLLDCGGNVLPRGFALESMKAKDIAMLKIDDGDMYAAIGDDDLFPFIGYINRHTLKIIWVLKDNFSFSGCCFDPEESQIQSDRSKAIIAAEPAAWVEIPTFDSHVPRWKREQDPDWATKLDDARENHIAEFLREKGIGSVEPLGVARKDNKAAMIARLLGREHHDAHAGSFALANACGVFLNMGSDANAKADREAVRQILEAKRMFIVQEGLADDDYSWAAIVDHGDTRALLELVKRGVRIHRPDYPDFQFQIVA